MSPSNYLILLVPVLCNALGYTSAFSSGTSFVAFKQPDRDFTLSSRSHRPTSSRGLHAGLTSTSEDADDSFAQTGVQRRRAFLAKFASASLLPFLSINPSPASARGAFEDGPLVYGDDSIMSQKEHGTSSAPVQENLRYGVSQKLADKICSFNRVFAEMGGYFESTSFENDVRKLVSSTGGPVIFYDSVTGKPLFQAPINRSVDDFIAESKIHGWPSFRDEEVVWSNVRVLRSSGETVSQDGTHLGHNLPDQKGNRYCINLVSVAGNPTSI